MTRKMAFLMQNEGAPDPDAGRVILKCNGRGSGNRESGILNSEARNAMWPVLPLSNFTLIASVPF